jgi:hypothetical protein
MRTRATTLALMLVLGPVLAACDSGVSMFEPDAEADFATASTADVTIDLETLERGSEDGALFDQLSDEIPGFGGLWFDRGCNLNVILTDESQSELATELLTPYLRRYVETHRCPNNASVVVHRGEFTWAQLSGWLRTLAPATDFPGVERLGIAIPANRIIAAVTGRPAANEVLRLAEDEGIPASALKFALASGSTTRSRR